MVLIEEPFGSGESLRTSPAGPLVCGEWSGITLANRAFR